MASSIPEGHVQSLALFERKPVDAGISKISYLDCLPTGEITHHSAINFFINDTIEEYFDLAKTRLYIRVKITLMNGDPITEDDNVGLINIPLHAFWSNVEVTLQNTLITTGVSTHYPYKCYYDIITSFEEDPKETQLQSVLFQKDTPFAMDDCRTGALGKNLGLKDRAAFTAGSKEVDLEGPLFIDLAQQDRLIINNIRFRLKLYQTTDEFRLMTCTHGKYKTTITQAILKLCKVEVTPDLILGHNAALLKTPALYPHKRSVMKEVTINAGLSRYQTDDLFSGQVPDRLIIGFVNLDAVSGSTELNPFNFQNYNLSHLSFQVNGTGVPLESFEPDYPNNLYVQPYVSLFTGKNIFNVNEGNDIERLDYPGGYTIYIFDIAGHRGKEYVTKPQYGHTRLSVRFNTGVPHAVIGMCYATFNSTITIDKMRNVAYENMRELYAKTPKTFTNPSGAPEGGG